MISPRVMELRTRADWVLVDRHTGMILRGLPRWEIAATVHETVAAIEHELDVRLAYENPRWIVVGEWRRKP